MILSLSLSLSLADDGDYTAVLPQTITFPAGQTEQTVVVSTLDDNIDEPLESLQAVLSAPNGNGLQFALGPDSTATVDIEDNDGKLNRVQGFVDPNGVHC